MSNYGVPLIECGLSRSLFPHNLHTLLDELGRLVNAKKKSQAYKQHPVSIIIFVSLQDLEIKHLLLQPLYQEKFNITAFRRTHASF